MYTQGIAMLTYGLDLNLSVKGLGLNQVIDLGQKLTYYSPYLVPFSFNWPFYAGRLWAGLSVRTFVRTGARPAVLMFVAKPEHLFKRFRQFGLIEQALSMPIIEKFII